MSEQNKKELYVDRNNDKYLGDLNLLNRRKNEWYAAHPKYKLYRFLTFLVFGLGCFGIYKAYLFTQGGSTAKEMLGNRFGNHSGEPLGEEGVREAVRCDSFCPN